MPDLNELERLLSEATAGPYGETRTGNAIVNEPRWFITDSRGDRLIEFKREEDRDYVLVLLSAAPTLIAQALEAERLHLTATGALRLLEMCDFDDPADLADMERLRDALNLEKP